MDLVNDCGLLKIIGTPENALNRAINCLLCKKQWEHPVRIKTCGHYFCTKCLKSSKKDHNCPECNEFYEIQHLDYNNIAVTLNLELLAVHKLLEEACNRVPEAPQKNYLSNSVSVSKPCHVPHVFLYQGDSYHVNFIVKPTKRNAKGETPLHLACKRQKFNEVRDLVESKVDINAKDYAGWAPLHEAIQAKNLEIIEYLLQKNCLINIPGAEYTTPLHQAASLDNVDIVKLLLKYGANKNMVDYTGLKPEDCTKFQPVLELFKTETLAVSGRKFEVFLPHIVCVYCHSVDANVKTKLQGCKDLEVANKMGKQNLTHFMIKKTHVLSFKILQAMLDGLQFVTQDMVEDLMKGNYFINIPEYTFLTTDPILNEGIQNAIISTILKLPKLFDGISFYIDDHTKPVEIYHLKVEKEYLAKLITAGGGKVLHRPPATRTCESEYGHPFFVPSGSNTYRCCNFILYNTYNPPDLIYNMKELQHKTSKWFIDCIRRYKIIE